MISIMLAQAALKRMRKEVNSVKGRVTETHRRILKASMTDAVQQSMQWSGNLTNQWYFEFAGVHGSYQPIPEYAEPVHGDAFTMDRPYQKGDDPAVSETLARELPKLAKVRYNTKVAIVNYAPYAAEADSGVGPNGRPIREVNRVQGFGATGIVGYLEAKYKNKATLRRLSV